MDKEKIVTQEELGEPALTDKAADRAEAQMKKIEGEAKKHVADGLDDEKLAREGERLVRQGEEDLNRQDD